MLIFFISSILASNKWEDRPLVERNKRIHEPCVEILNTEPSSDTQEKINAFCSLTVRKDIDSTPLQNMRYYLEHVPTFEIRHHEFEMKEPIPFALERYLFIRNELKLSDSLKNTISLNADAERGVSDLELIECDFDGDTLKFTADFKDIEIRDLRGNASIYFDPETPKFSSFISKYDHDFNTYHFKNLRMQCNNERADDGQKPGRYYAFSHINFSGTILTIRRMKFFTGCKLDIKGLNVFVQQSDFCGDDGLTVDFSKLKKFRADNCKGILTIINYQNRPTFKVSCSEEGRFGLGLREDDPWIIMENVKLSCENWTDDYPNYFKVVKDVQFDSAPTSDDILHE